jgi:hypothetical protein
MALIIISKRKLTQPLTPIKCEFEKFMLRLQFDRELSKSFLLSHSSIEGSSNKPFTFVIHTNILKYQQRQFQSNLIFTGKLLDEQELGYVTVRPQILD